MFAMAAAQVRKGLEVAKKFRAEGFSELLLCMCVIFLKIHHTHLLLVGGGGVFCLFCYVSLFIIIMIVWPHLLCQNTGYSLM